MPSVTPLNVPHQQEIDALVNKIIQLIDYPQIAGPDGQFSEEQLDKYNEIVLAALADVITIMSFDTPGVLEYINNHAQDLYECEFVRTAPQEDNVIPLKPPED